MRSNLAVPIRVVMVFDDGHARHAAAVLHSASQTLAPGYRLEAHLIAAELSMRSTKGLERLNGACVNLSIVVHPSETDRFDTWMHGGHISAAAYLRLELGDHLPDDVDRVIYLDTDVWCRSSLHQLFEIDLEGHSIGAVRDTSTPVMSAERGVVRYEQLGLSADAPYFNSGVMLIDLEGWRSADPVAFGMGYVAANGDVQQALDQEILNVLFADDWVEIPLRWNVSPRLLRVTSWPEGIARSIFEPLAGEALATAGIIHFLGPSKPWTYGADTAWSEEYLESASACAFYRTRFSFLLWRLSAVSSAQRKRARRFVRTLRRRLPS